MASRKIRPVHSECAHETRRQPEHIDPVLCAESPKPIWSRMIERTIVKAHRRAENQRAVDHPWPHHPAEVADPANTLDGMNIHIQRHVLRCLYRESAVRM